MKYMQSLSHGSSGLGQELDEFRKLDECQSSNQMAVKEIRFSLKHIIEIENVTVKKELLVLGIFGYIIPPKLSD